MQTVGVENSLKVCVEEKIFVHDDQQKVILSAIEFDVSPNELTVITGPSGCGKSTLLNIIAGLDDQFSGSIIRPPHHKDGIPVSYVFQDPTLLPWETIARNITLINPTLENDPLALDQLLSSLGLAGTQDKYPRKLSLGMARRVGLARAFSAQAPVLLLDEPFVSLDELTAETLRKLLLKQLQHRQMMAVFVTHNLREALFLADRLIILGDTPTRVVENIAFEPGTRGRTLEEVESLRNELIQDYAWVLG